MGNTLILFKPLAEFGEALKKDCPKNDCVVYRNTYEQYCEAFADYKHIKEACDGLHDTTIRALEHAIREAELTLHEMWANNYAVLKQREALGMGSAPKVERKNTTVFEAVTKDAPTLAKFLASLPVLEAPWDTEFQKRYCKKCPPPDCDYCPNNAFRNNPAWWLALDASGVEL